MTHVYNVKQDEVAFLEKPSQNLLCPICDECELFFFFFQKKY